KKLFLADAVNRTFSTKQLAVSYSGSFEEHRPRSQEEKEIHLPNKPELHCEKVHDLGCDSRGTCIPYFLGLARDESKKAQALCKRAADALGGVAGAIQSACEAVCVDTPLGKACIGDVVNPGACASAKATKAANEGILNACRATIDLTSRFLTL